MAGVAVAVAVAVLFGWNVRGFMALVHYMMNGSKEL